MANAIINKNDGLIRIETINQAEQTGGFDGAIIYVGENKTIYEFEANSLEVADGTLVLNTGSSGNTRWIGTAGKYSTYGDNTDGLMDFIESTNGYVNNGLFEKNYNLNFGNWFYFIESIKNVLVYGIYDKE